jgi:hypothetical protein
MKKIIWTTSIKLNDLFANELDLISSSVNTTEKKSIIVKNMTEGAIVYLDNDWNSTAEDWYPIKYEWSISFDKWVLSNIQICSSIENTDVRFLFV